MRRTRKGILGILGAGFGLALTLALLGLWAPGASAKPTPSLLRVSTDPYSDPGGQHRTEVEPDTFSDGKQIVGAFQVGRTFTGGGSNIGWVSSPNGGKSFKSGFLPGITEVVGGPFDRVSDPSVAYDAAHRVWLISSLALDGQPLRGVEIVVSRSHDGRHWGSPLTLAAAQGGADFDKNWTVCDNSRSSPFYGHCYTQFDDFGEADRIKMSTSTDGGLTWSAPTNTADNNLGLGGQPVVQPDGTVIVLIPNLIQTALQAFRSTDGGQSWSPLVPVSVAPHHRVAGGLRESTLPSAEVDGDGKVYAAWPDCRFRAGCAANDIVISTTTDGIDWSPVTRVPIDPVDSGADHFIPGLAVDPDSSGDHARLALTYYSYPEADCTAETCRLTVGFVSSPDGGATWSAPTELAAPMRLDWLPETSQGRMVGDYISTSFVKGRAVPLFAQAEPPSGGLFDEAIATFQGGLPVGAPQALAPISQAPVSAAADRAGPAPSDLRPHTAR